jgi:preprotein translocase subunit YajC
MDFSQLGFDLIILVLFVLGIYVFSVLPRQREFSNRQKLVSQLKPGTEVITYGGLIGTVKQVDADNGVITLEIAQGIEARFLAQSISSEFDAQAVGDSAKKASK